jgi:hypothetical protein
LKKVADTGDGYSGELNRLPPGRYLVLLVRNYLLLYLKASRQ